MNKMKRLLLFSGMFLLQGFAFGQTALSAKQAADEFRQVNKAYLDAEKLQMNIDYTLYSSYTSAVPFEKENGVYMKQGNSTYSHLLGTVSLTNSKMSLTLDSNEQTIVLTDAPTKNDRNPSLVNLDSLLSMCSSIESKDAGGNLQLYRLRFDRLSFIEYTSIDVYIDRRTHFLDRLVLFFRMEMDLDENDDVYVKDRPRLDIHYSNISTAPVFSADQFSEKKFIQGTGKKFTCTASYATYRLINNQLK